MGAFFAPEDARYSSDIEVKWASHPAGDRREAWAAGGDVTTLTVLVSGLFLVQFAEGAYRLERPGDYVLLGPSFLHRWEAVEDSTMLTVRWRATSVEGDEVADGDDPGEWAIPSGAHTQSAENGDQ
jgi:hypothetical protein